MSKSVYALWEECVGNKDGVTVKQVQKGVVEIIIDFDAIPTKKDAFRLAMRVANHAHINIGDIKWLDGARVITIITNIFG